jgi:hypothetical protein
VISPLLANLPNSARGRHTKTMLYRTEARFDLKKLLSVLLPCDAERARVPVYPISAAS